jgi:tetratricopeptide (TPR) repeat protein
MPKLKSPGDKPSATRSTTISKIAPAILLAILSRLLDLASSPTQEKATWGVCLTATDPDSPQWSRSLAVSYLRMGEMHHAVGDLPAALSTYITSYAAFERCASRDPFNVEVQHKMSISLERTADIESALGDQSGALKEYRGSQVIRFALAERFPDNTRYLSALGILQNKIGDLYRAHRNLPAALVAYQAAHAAFDRLA